jgi:hypothetical protein
MIRSYKQLGPTAHIAVIKGLLLLIYLFLTNDDSLPQGFSVLNDGVVYAPLGATPVPHSTNWHQKAHYQY